MDNNVFQSTRSLTTRDDTRSIKNRSMTTFSEGKKRGNDESEKECLKTSLRLPLDRLHTDVTGAWTTGKYTTRSTNTTKTDISRAETLQMTSHAFDNIEKRGQNMLSDMRRRFLLPIETKKRSKKIVLEKMRKGRLTEEQQRWIEEEKVRIQKEELICSRGHKVTDLEKLEIQANQVRHTRTCHTA